MPRKDPMKKLILFCTAAALVAACGQKQDTKTATQLVQPTNTVAPSTQAAEASRTAVPVQSPHGTAVPQASPEKVSGTVAETLDSSGFTYVRLTTDQGDKWVVVRQTPLKKGAKITVTTNMVADKFESKSLKRTFDKLIFGELEGAAPPPMASAAGASSAPGQTPAPSPATGMISPHGAPAAASGAASTPPPAMAAMMKAQHSGMAAGPVDDAPIKVAKAEGASAKTVAEIWASRATSREGEQVVVRGKVVKFLSGIMGKNWVHLRDGSGSHDKGDNDITITTNDTVAVGNVVLVSGVIHLNKDFGAGYSYPVIIEEAKIK
jgi:hypothetical protein